MNEPKRIQRKRTRGWRMPTGAVCVGRGSKFGNPFRIHEGASASVVVYQFEQWLQCSDEGKLVVEAAQRELRGKTLACWCKEGAPCHADVLLQIANQKSN